MCQWCVSGQWPFITNKSDLMVYAISQVGKEVVQQHAKGVVRNIIHAGIGGNSIIFENRLGFDEVTAISWWYTFLGTRCRNCDDFCRHMHAFDAWLQLLCAGRRVTASSYFVLRPRLPQPDHLSVHSKRRTASARQVPAGTRPAVYTDWAAERDWGPASSLGLQAAVERDALSLLPAQGVRAVHGRTRRDQLPSTDTDLRDSRWSALEPTAGMRSTLLTLVSLPIGAVIIISTDADSPITHGSSSSSPSSPSSLSPLSILFWPRDLALQQILSSIDFFLFYRTDSTDS